MPGVFNALTSYQPQQRNALMGAGYVNQSDGSVGIVGKAIGALGLDLEGRRAATSWEDAWHNSVDPAGPGQQAGLFPITSDGGYGVPGLISTPMQGFQNMWERGDEANIANPDALDQSSRESFDAAGLAATGGLAAGMVGAVPEGAVAANGIGGRLKGWFGGRPAEAPKIYGQGDLRLTKPNPENGRFNIIGRDGEILGEATVYNYDGAAQVERLTMRDGSNSIGLKGLRDLREAYREFDPEAKKFAGLRSNDMKTGAALDGSNSARAPKYRNQEVDLYSNSPNAASVPLAMQAMERSAARGAEIPEWAQAINWEDPDFGIAPQGPPARYGKGQYTLEQPPIEPGFGAGTHEFNILKGDDPVGNALVHRDGNTATVTRMETADGSNSLGLGGIRDLREAFRQFDPAVTEFTGTRHNNMKTGAALEGLHDAERPITRRQTVNLYSNNGSAASVPLALNAMEKPKGFTAYHGSPHDFDKFDLSKIGTGEGAQAYGHGLYFAENEGVAKSYRDALSGADGRYENLTPTQQTAFDAFDGGSDPSSAVSYIDGRIADLQQRAAKGAASPDLVASKVAELAKSRDLIESGWQPPPPPGKMYEVNINADPEQFLDWDAPLALQPEPIRALAQQRGLHDRPAHQWEQKDDVHMLGSEDNYPLPYGLVEPSPRGFSASIAGRGMGERRLHDDIDAARAWVEEQMGIFPDKRVGADLYQALASDPVEASRLLKEAGIPGLRYYDQGSRRGASRTPDADAGTRNHVLFDDSLVDINRKYANHPFASASPLAFTDQQDNQNALMPTSLSKKEKDHHSLNQPRTASGQFTR